ncbi:chromatin modification-related protein EAF7-domain-containing protein [Massariosphaeria phaeospora]|uniref:Chromatin modification-related protein EAF7-domain-containing protein n=1 Tax=Massariosphaeria phaeospora TaxID=100035 RepID=A0A7C8I4D3_9PLEO|nr:chromatin modification-related protein EAF7-domain-containing protein [Massariosphaeria phaeospora]
MPPRKRAKASAASTPLAETQPKTPQATGVASQSQSQSQSKDQDLHNDPWADEQETQLYKSLMKWKPTGMHKHFRMISIHNDMRSHGFATEDAPHTRIPGIWRKLEQCYKLSALDERETEYAFSDQPDPTDREEAYNLPDFELPEDEFGELMWQKRFHGSESEAASSPPSMPTEDDKALYHPGLGLLKDLPDGVRSQKAESVVEATPTPKNAKTTRASRATAKSGKGAKAGQATKNSKAQSAVSESPGDEDEDDDDEESSAESEEEVAPSTRRTGRSGARTRAAPKRTRKR